MTYLFWSFAVVWIALFAYVRALVRRTRALEDEVRRLADGVSHVPRTAQLEEGGFTPLRRDAPSPAGRAAP
jgi:CcmD family protein